MKNEFNVHIPFVIYFAYTITCIFLSVILLLIKLSNIIYISWFWVFAPIWMPSCIIAVVLFVAFNIMMIKDSFQNRKKYAKKDVYNE